MPLVFTRSDCLKAEVLDAEIPSLGPIGSIPGVAIKWVAGLNGPGTAAIRDALGGGLGLCWKAPESETFGTQVDCSTGGTFMLEDGENKGKFVRVTVYPNHLNDSATEASVVLNDIYENGISGFDTEADDADSGLTHQNDIKLVNQGTIPCDAVRVWLGPDVADREISLNDVDYYAPDSENHADVLRIARIEPGAEVTIYVRDTYNTAGPVSSELLELETSFNAL